MAEEQTRASGDERRRALDLEREQAAYEARAAERRFHSVDADNRLVAAELEARWNLALKRVTDCEARLATLAAVAPPLPERDVFQSLARDLESVWNAPSTTMQLRQQLVRTLVEEIVVDVDNTSREIILLIHWCGGRHSELRVRKPEPGEHSRRTTAAADTLIREMAPRWPDDQIAAVLNRKGLLTAHGKTWTRERVRFHRQYARIAGCNSSEAVSWLTMDESAKALGVSPHRIRALIENGVLAARQAMKDSPWQILPTDLHSAEVRAALEAGTRTRPRRKIRDTETLEIPGVRKGGAQ